MNLNVKIEVSDIEELNKVFDELITKEKECHEYIETLNLEVVVAKSLSV